MSNTGMIRLLAWVGLSAAAAAAPPPAATLAVVNARIWTGNPQRPWAGVIAISGERILAVGSGEEIRKVLSPSTRVVDGGGCMLTPGFIDAHIHISPFNRSTYPPLNLRFPARKADVFERLANYVANVPKGTWIFGEGWTERLWGGRPPSRRVLDRIAPDHPVWLYNARGDAGLANSAALRAAGITRSTNEGPAGAIARDAHGEPDGLIRGGPMWLIDAAVIEQSRDQDDRVLGDVLRRLAGAGITSVHHTGGWEDILIFQRAYKAGRLPVRIYACPGLSAWVRMRDYVAAHGRGDAWLRWGGLKGFGNMADEEAYAWISGASRAGLQVMVHVFPKPGLNGLLDIYARVRREQNLRDPRFRIEHAHQMPPEIIRKFADTGVIASVQPPLLAHFDRGAPGPPPFQMPYPWREVLRSGIVIALGTDSPATASFITPLESIQLALERPGPDGRPLTLEEALRGYTRDAAFAEFAENEKGTLEPGKLADFVLLDSDLTRVPAHLIKTVRVRMTVAGGKITYEAASQPGSASEN